MAIVDARVNGADLSMEEEKLASLLLLMGKMTSQAEPTISESVSPVVEEAVAVAPPVAPTVEPEPVEIVDTVSTRPQLPTGDLYRFPRATRTLVLGEIVINPKSFEVAVYLGLIYRCQNLRTRGRRRGTDPTKSRFEYISETDWQNSEQNPHDDSVSRSEHMLFQVIGYFVGSEYREARDIKDSQSILLGTRKTHKYSRISTTSERGRVVAAKDWYVCRIEGLSVAPVQPSVEELHIENEVLPPEISAVMRRDNEAQELFFGEIDLQRLIDLSVPALRTMLGGTVMRIPSFTCRTNSTRVVNVGGYDRSLIPGVYDLRCHQVDGSMIDDVTDKGNVRSGGDPHPIFKGQRSRYLRYVQVTASDHYLRFSLSRMVGKEYHKGGEIVIYYRITNNSVHVIPYADYLQFERQGNRLGLH